MGVFSVTTTVSHRYYARKPKREIVAALRDMLGMLRRMGSWVAPALTDRLAKTDAELMRESRHDLAWIAIRLHTYFPDDAA